MIPDKRTALIFLNGFYDTRQLPFYRKAIQSAITNGYLIVCADGGLHIFECLNRTFGLDLWPTYLIGDLDSVNPNLYSKASTSIKTVSDWIGHTDKDSTDGQLAVELALRQFDFNYLCIYGSLPHRYETDHFLANLKLLRLANKIRPDVQVVLNDPQQAIYRLRSKLTIRRHTSDSTEQISLIAHDKNVKVRYSQGLRWNLNGLWIDPDKPTAVRNEFQSDAEEVIIELEVSSDPVLVIHNF